MNTHRLRALSMRIKNLQIRANDLAELLNEHGCPDEGALMLSTSRNLKHMFECLTKRADVGRDARGAKRGVVNGDGKRAAD